MRTFVILTVSFTLMVSTLSADPPESTLRIPLTAAPDDGAPHVVAPADEPAQKQLYYYNGVQKVYLNDTGRAVAKLKGEVNAEKAWIRAHSISVEFNDPLAELVPALRRSRLVIVRTRGPRALSLHKADDLPKDVDYLLPIVEEDTLRGAEHPPKSPGRSSPMIMTTTISARFSSRVTGEVPAEKKRKVEEFVGPFGLKVVKESDIPNGYSLGLAKGPITYQRLLKAGNRLYEKGRPQGEVIYAKPDFIRVKQRHQQIQDPRYPNQWHLNNTGQGGGLVDADIDAPEAWAISEGQRDIRVAIIDDSVEKDHPDLAGNYLAGRYYNGFTIPPSFTNDPSPKDPLSRHGTACAGVAVGTANQIGVRGSAPRCGLIGVHFWDSSDSQMAEAFYFCNDPDGDPSTDDGAAVISCSWSLNISPPADLTTAIDELARTGRGGRGTVILFAAANDWGLISVHQNLARESVICVGATSNRDVRSWYSNYGPELEVVAPSSDHWPQNLRIDTTDNTDPPGEVSGYAVGDYTGNGEDGFGGTSSATPLTAGVCALILSANPNLSALQVRAILEHTCDRIRGGGSFPSQYSPTTSHDPNYGYGRVNAKRAAHVARSSLTDPHVVWPDHVQDLKVTYADSMAKLTWKNPADNVTGVLVVSSQNAQGVRWKPRDGERYAVGDLVGDGTIQVISIDRIETIEQPIGAGHPQFAVFVYNGDFKYSWGKTVRLTLQPGVLPVATNRWQIQPPHAANITALTDLSEASR